MRRFLAVFAALALTTLLAAPAMAGKPNLTFTTHLTWQPTTATNCCARLPGDMNSGFTAVTHGVPGVQYMFATTGTKLNPGVVDVCAPNTGGDTACGYPFYLKASPTQQATLRAYFAAKNWGIPAYYDQINAEIAGTLPFFWAVWPGNVLNNPFLADGFEGSAALDCVLNPSPWCFPPHMAFLTMDDDYPVGTYTYEGTLLGTNGATKTLDIMLTVVRD